MKLATQAFRGSAESLFAAGREISLVQVRREIVRRSEMMNDYYSALSTANTWPCSATAFSFVQRKRRATRII
jgi:hypothetical protein